MDFKKYDKLLIGVFIFAMALFLLEVYFPKSFSENQVLYEIKRGDDYKNISQSLQEQGIIKSSLFFRIYVLVSLNYPKLQAGKYELSPSMTITEITKKFVLGDIVKNKITVIEGWSIDDLERIIEERKIFPQKEFENALKADFSGDFEFLRDKPKGMGLEGYIFPDTYYLAENATAEEFIKISLVNFDKKLSIELKNEIESQKKTIFQVITMASMIEREVKSLEDRKMVSGILWKRIKEGVPLQVDATVNYVTGKNDAKVKINDTKIDSPYNTYKYYGLPRGPISNPGMDSILAAIYPEKSDFWYYLSADGTGNTVFSKTLDEHNLAIAKYFK